MRTQLFGVEVEMTGLTRMAAARVIAGHFRTEAVHVGGSYEAYSVRDGSGREWKIMYDASIIPQNRNGASASDLYRVEVVSPVCSYDDIDSLQKILRKLRKSGAVVNESCGIHVHIDAGPHTPKTLKNIVNIIAAKEDLLYKALKIHVRREDYCKKTDTDFLDRINRRGPASMDDIRLQWYRGYVGNEHARYHDSRYQGLNLHSVFYRGTIEFRLFNSTLHAGELKTYIQICLAISHQALNQQRASHSKTASANEKYTFRTWLLHLGLIGKEFETARHHLLKNLEGNIAWKDPAQAEAQKLRLAQRPRAEEDTVTDACDNCSAEADSQEVSGPVGPSM